MESIKALINQLQASFATLSVRERRMVAGAGSVVLLFVLFMVVNSFSTKANTIRHRTAEKIEKLAQVQELAATFREAKSRQDGVERDLAASNVHLVSLIEDKGKTAGLPITTINPKADVPLEGEKIIETAAEFTLTDVKLGRLVEFLQSIEQGPGIIKVKYLRLEPRPQNETLTAFVTVATYRLKN